MGTLHLHPPFGPMLSFSRMYMQAIVLEAAATCPHDFSVKPGMDSFKVSMISTKSFFLNFNFSCFRACQWLKTTG